MWFELFLGKLGGLLLSKVGESFWSKVVDKTTDKAVDGLNNFNEFEFTLKTLQKNLNSLSAKASDVEEGIKSAELSGRKKRKREVEVWLAAVKLFEKEVDALGGSQVEAEGFIKKMIDGGKAAQLDKQVKELVEQSRYFGELVLDVCGTNGDTFLTDGMVGEAFSENLERIMELLEKREVSSIGVHGMGGVGKTTLAKHVNNRLLQQAEGRVLWVTVSQEFTIRSLQDKIARLLGVNLSDEDEEDMRAMRLHRALSREKNSVLILDDVWEKIDMKKVGCTFSAECCRLIVTTRSLEVCHQICCQIVIRVGKLGEEEAWKLFSETLGDETELGPQVEGVAKSVAKMCDGLPLGIITVAGSMRGEKAAHMWKNALTELEESVAGQDGMGDIEVFKVLKYSFDRLKRNGERESNGFNMIQHCFLYCSLYPEDYEIRTSDLVIKFISEGLLNERRSRRDQVVQGRSILDKLVKLCLLETCVDYDGKEGVKMHDLVRSMALRICKGKYLVRAGIYYLEEIPNEEEWTKDLEKVSLMKCGIDRIGEGFSPDCPKLSTLLLQGNHKLKVIPESFFSKMQGLCTLDLYLNREIAMLPDSISDLACLKSLILEGCWKLKSVPCLGKMKALRELNLSGTAIKEAPQGLEELLNLRFLSMNAPGLKMLPRGVFLKLVHLEHLNIPLDILVSTEEIKNLKRLEEFNGGVKSVSDFNWFVRSRGHGPCYKIGVSMKDVESSILIFGWNNNELVLNNCNLKNEKVLGKGIVILRISKCKGLSKWLVDDLSEGFDNLTSLRKLKISCCGGIEWIFKSIDDGQGSQISTLNSIELKELDDLKGVMERETGGIGIGIVVVASAAQPPVFSSLKKLSIFRCKKMRKLGLPVSALPNLEQIIICDCEEVEEIFEEEEEDEGRDSATTLPKLRELELQNLPRLRKVGLPAASGVPNLEQISIESCGEIQEIFEKEKEDEGRDSATTLPKLRKLRLEDLPRLRKVGLPAASGVPNLKKICIDGCGEIEEIFEKEKEDEGRDSASTLPKLTTLELTGLPRLRKVGLPAASRVPNLEEIEIRECEEVEEIFECEEVEEIFEDEDEGRAADSIVTILPKLRKLHLEDLPRLRKVGLPAASGVPNLEQIDIQSCGEIQEIFEDEDEGRAADSIVTLPKLRVLELNDLARLKRVSKATIISNSIWSINITKCPELKNRLPLDFEDQAAPPPSLREIWVERGWWESLEWDKPDLPQLLQPLIHFGDS